MIIFKHWQLIKHLTLREIKARYKQSFLGIFWVILNPFFQMLILSFVFSNIMKFPNIAVPYPVFLYAGLLPWIFLVNSLTSSMSVLIENASLIKKIYFPREILVISTIFAKTFDFFLSTAVFLILMFWFGIPLTFFSPFFFLIFAIQFLFVLGLGLFLSVMNLLYRDVQYLINLVITVWFYLTPVIYSVEFFPEKYRWIFKLNPMSIYINAYRQVLFGNDWPNLISLGLGILFSLGFFYLSFKFFKKVEGIFADVV